MTLVTFHDFAEYKRKMSYQYKIAFDGSEVQWGQAYNWLRDRTLDFTHDRRIMMGTSGSYFTIKDLRIAILFKLTWG